MKFSKLGLIIFCFAVLKCIVRSVLKHLLIYVTFFFIWDLKYFVNVLWKNCIFKIYYYLFSPFFRSQKILYPTLILKIFCASYFIETSFNLCSKFHVPLKPKTKHNIDMNKSLTEGIVK